MDGIGSRPRLRASGADGDPMADRAYPIEAVADVPAAMAIAGAWLRDELQHRPDRRRPSRRPWRPGLRPAGADRSRRGRRGSSATSRWRRCISRTIWRRSARCWQASRRCRRSPASTRHFTATTMRSPTTTRSRSSFYAEGVRRYGFHGLSYEYVAKRLPQVAPDIANGRVIVAHLGSGASMCAHAGRPERREHHGLYRARRAADGNAARARSIPASCSISSPRRACRRRRCRISSTATAA